MNFNNVDSNDIIDITQGLTQIRAESEASFERSENNKVMRVVHAIFNSAVALQSDAVRLDPIKVAVINKQKYDVDTEGTRLLKIILEVFPKCIYFNYSNANLAYEGDFCSFVETYAEFYPKLNALLAIINVNKERAGDPSEYLIDEDLATYIVRLISDSEVNKFLFETNYNQDIDSGIVASLKQTIFIKIVELEPALLGSQLTVDLTKIAEWQRALLGSKLTVEGKVDLTLFQYLIMNEGILNVIPSIVPVLQQLSLEEKKELFTTPLPGGGNMRDFITEAYMNVRADRGDTKDILLAMYDECVGITHNSAIAPDTTEYFAPAKRAEDPLNPGVYRDGTYDSSKREAQETIFANIRARIDEDRKNGVMVDEAQYRENIKQAAEKAYNSFEANSRNTLTKTPRLNESERGDRRGLNSQRPNKIKFFDDLNKFLDVQLKHPLVQKQADEVKRAQRKRTISQMSGPKLLGTGLDFASQLESRTRTTQPSKARKTDEELIMAEQKATYQYPGTTYPTPTPQGFFRYNELLERENALDRFVKSLKGKNIGQLTVLLKEAQDQLNSIDADLKKPGQDLTARNPQVRLKHQLESKIKAINVKMECMNKLSNISLNRLSGFRRGAGVSFSQMKQKPNAAASSRPKPAPAPKVPADVMQGISSMEQNVSFEETQLDVFMFNQVNPVFNENDEMLTDIESEGELMIDEECEAEMSLSEWAEQSEGFAKIEFSNLHRNSSVHALEQRRADLKIAIEFGRAEESQELYKARWELETLNLLIDDKNQRARMEREEEAHLLAMTAMEANTANSRDKGKDKVKKN